MQVVEQKKPGFVDFTHLDDLWFMVGSRCNLSCSHCYVSSSPTNDTLEQISISDIEPFLLEAKGFGVKDIYFTGGEPFINKDILAMIGKSLEIANVTILTNATFPISRFVDELKQLNENSSHDLKFRVSLDHYDQAKHDAIRGEGNFVRTVVNVVRLFEVGFIIPP